MATFRKRKKSWRAEICKDGVRKSATFDTKAAAQAWAAMEEIKISSGKKGIAHPSLTFADLLDEYYRRVSTTKRGERWECVRIELIKRDPIAKVRLSDLAAPHVTAWRDRRLSQVSADSVRREWNLLGHACNVAMKEWHWLSENPFKDVKRPTPSPPRDRRISDDEIERLLFALGYDYHAPPTTQTARVGAAMLFAIETAMRAGEICALRWPDIIADKRFLKVRGEAKGGGKTASARRDVALSAEALRIIEQLRPTSSGDSVFSISSTQSLDAIFRKAKSRAMITDLHFHDTRHEAITRLAKRLDVLSLARMVGHKDLKMLMIYYNETAEEIAGKL